MRLRTGAASRIHAGLHGGRLHLERGRLLTQPGRRWVREHAWPVFGPEQQRLVRTHWAPSKGLTTMIRSLDRRIEHVGREIPAVSVLRTIPGIGPYRGAALSHRPPHVG